MRCPTKTQEIIHIDDIEIDVASLFSISHRCVPGMCPEKQCCCSKYEIAVDSNEIDSVVGYMPAASKYAPRLGNMCSLENIFEEDEEGDFIVDTDKAGLCAFAYRDRQDCVLCSLHTVAMDLKLPFYKTKPMSCVLWPLAITEDLPLQISIADDAFSFPCNTRRKDTDHTLDPNIAEIIQNIFGIRILTAINRTIL